MAFAVHALRIGIVVTALRLRARDFARADAGETAYATTDASSDGRAVATACGSADQCADRSACHRAAHGRICLCVRGRLTADCIECVLAAFAVIGTETVERFTGAGERQSAGTGRDSRAAGSKNYSDERCT
jgi:hypothetical protein